MAAQRPRTCGLDMAEVSQAPVDKRSTAGQQWRMAIEIRLLGPLEVLVDSERVDLGTSQQRTLLALLALHAGSAVRLTAIEDVLWEAKPPPSATKVVQTYVSRLRRLLGADSIQFAESGYTLDAGVCVDAIRFRELVERRQFAQALALWRGDALSDVPALDADARQLDEFRVSAIEERIDAELDRGEGPALVPELETLVADYPTRERLLGQLVLALYRSGRQADALTVYRSGREAFIELGLEPGPALRELELRILRHDPTLLPAAAPHRARRPPSTTAANSCRGHCCRRGGHGHRDCARWSSGHAKAVVPIRANTLLELDPTTNQIVGSIPIGRDAAALEATRDALWIASERERAVSRIDLRTHAVKTIGEPHPVAFIAHDDRGNIYASGWDFPFVWQINPRTVQIVRQFKVKTRALGLAVGGGSLWVVDRLANAVTRIDLAQRRVAETVRVGVNPLASSFGYGALWVANGDSGTVSVIRPGRDEADPSQRHPQPLRHQRRRRGHLGRLERDARRLPHRPGHARDRQADRPRHAGRLPLRRVRRPARRLGRRGPPHRPDQPRERPRGHPDPVPAGNRAEGRRVDPDRRLDHGRQPERRPVTFVGAEHDPIWVSAKSCRLPRMPPTPVSDVSSTRDAAVARGRLEALRMIRIVRGYSLKDVAGRSGLSAGYIQKIERGEIKEPSPHRLRRIAGALDYPYPQLLVLAGYVDDDATGSSPEARDLGVLGDAIGGAGHDDAEAGFLAATLTAYRELRAAGAEPPTDFLLAVMLEYRRLNARGSLIGADEL